MRRRQVVVLSLVISLAFGAATTVAGAGAPSSSGSRLEGDGAMDSGKETHDHDAQHGSDEGHLEPRQQGVDLIGFTDLFAPGEEPGRIGDVSAKGDHAYLTLYYEPTCDRGGIQIVDISDPANPTKVGYVPSHLGTFAGEGSQVISIANRHFTGDVLIYQNEICPGQDKRGVGGITLVDVTDPRKPKKLVEGFGDFKLNGQSQTHANQVHSAFAWTNDETGRTYVVMTDDEEATDTDIVEITNPSRPRFVAEYDFAPRAAQDPGEVHGDASFIHDEVVKKIDGRYVGLLSYWDAGYIQIDLTDPADAAFLRDSDYAAVDPVLLARTGTELTPEGNGHQAEFTRDSDLIVATDEDFDPYRVLASIEDGPHAGTTFTAIQGSATAPIDVDTAIVGDTRFAGSACDPATVPAPDADHPIALIERGGCDFVVKIANVEAAGYGGAVVFNRTGVDGCETLVTMLADGHIPAVFVSRTVGMQLLGADLDGYTCSEDGTGTVVPAAVGADGSAVRIAVEFDGWGYVHLFDAGTMEDLDQFAIPEAHDPAFAEGHGDLSVHEVATDPDDDLVYVSYYAGGLRVLRYSDDGLTEVGAFIAGPGMTTTSGTPVTQSGNTFWGVEVHDHPNGQQYVLASDRDSGVWIFQVPAT